MARTFNSLGYSKHSGCYGEVLMLDSLIYDVGVEGASPDNRCQPRSDSQYVPPPFIKNEKNKTIK